MRPIRTIAEIPFHARPLLELLNLHEYRAAPDPDYAGFGHARAASVVLEDGEGRRRIVDDALILAVHSADEPEQQPDDDLELEFIVDEADPDSSITVLLSDFLRIWLPQLRGDHRAIVLVACNPHRAHFAPPAGAAGTPVHYPVGDVESWLDEDDQHRPTLRFVAGGWRTAE